MLRRRGRHDHRTEVHHSRSGRTAAVLGPARLAVTALSSAGDVRTACPGGRIAIVLDGRIYNSPELRSELKRLGEEFSAGTEPEVILRGYRIWGDAVVEHLRGSFAFALWDGRDDGRLVLARDKFGRKPLYFRQDAGDALRFASKLTALLDKGIPREVDPVCLRHYLEHGYPPPGRCMLRGYRMVLPGCLLAWEGGRLRRKQYWRPPDGERGRPPPRATAVGLQERLEEAVKARLGAGGPVGAILWGGVGSAIIAALMAQVIPGPPPTYTACFGVDGLADAERARRTALRLGSRHRAIMVGPRAGRLMPFVASQMDEPIADPWAIPTYLLCRRARDEVAVLLSGHGSVGSCGESTSAPFACAPSASGPAVPAEPVLTTADRMSTAASVELRMPFLDEGLAPWTMSLQGSACRGRLAIDALLRKAMRDRLPPHMLRPRRRGRIAPLDEWLRSEWRELARDVLLDPGTRWRGWTDQDQVRRLLDEHCTGRASHGRRLHRLLVLELWARSILDRGQAEPRPADVDDCMRDLPADRPVRRVAVIAPAGIGDTMRLAPAIRRLGASDQAVSVTLYVAAGRGSDQPMAGLPPVDRHVPIDLEAQPVTRVLRLARDIRRSAPDELVSTWVSRLAGPVGLLSRAKNRRGWVPQWSWTMRLAGALWPGRLPYDPPQKGAGLYDISSFCRLLGVGDGAPTALQFAPPIWEERALKVAHRRMAELERPLLAVGAAAGRAIRQREYPLDLMAAAVDRLLREGVAGSVVLLGDGASRRRVEPLAEAAGRQGLNLCGSLSISATAAVMRKCDAALVVDGGLLHVALASELPVVVLYGPTEVFPSDPRGGTEMFKAISAFEQCRCGCLPHRGIRARSECRQQAQCLARILPERIVAALAAMLSTCAVA